MARPGVRDSVEEEEEEDLNCKCALDRTDIESPYGGGRGQRKCVCVQYDDRHGLLQLLASSV